MSKLFWDEDLNRVFAGTTYFECKEDFIKCVCDEYFQFHKCECVVTDTKVQSCISTLEGLEDVSITPISETDIEIKLMYVGNYKKVSQLSFKTE